MRRIFLVFLLVAGLAGPAFAQSLTAGVGSLGHYPSAYPAPAAVYVDGYSGSFHPNASTNENRWAHLRYEWNFNDPGAGSYAYGARESKNLRDGPIAAHVYGQPGFKTIDLTVRDQNGASANARATLSLDDPDAPGDGWGDPGETWCVARSADPVPGVGGCPASASVCGPRGGCSTRGFDTIVNEKLASGGRRILFKSGESWSAGGSANLGWPGPGMISSYGPGKAAVNFSGGNLFILTQSNWRITNLTLTGNGSNRVFFCAGNGPDYILIHGNTLTGRSYHEGIQAWAQSCSSPPDLPDYWTVSENDFGATDHQPSQGYLSLTGGSYHAYIGNHFGRMHRDTYGWPLRMILARGIVISNNLMDSHPYFRGSIALRTGGTNDAGGPCAGGMAWELCNQPARQLLIQANNIAHHESGASITAGGCGTGCSDFGSEDVVVERNYAYEQPGGNATNSFTGFTQPRRVTVRNNIADVTGWKYGAAGIWSGGDVYNNICFRTDTADEGTTWSCVEGANSCYNNAYYAPNFGPNAVVSTQPQCSAANNNFSGKVNPFVVTPPGGGAAQRSHFVPAAGSALHNGGQVIAGLIDDALGNCRTSAIDVGAVERDSSGCNGAVAVPLDPLPAAPVLLP